MQANRTTTHLVLDGHQGTSITDGWRILDSSLLEATADGLSLAKKPSPPVALKDDPGTLAGFENPTGVAIGPDGSIYLSDATNHKILRVVRREGLRTMARYYDISGAPFDQDRFVYVPSANRLERWPGTLRRDPENLSEVEVLCETVWNKTQARKLVESIIRGESRNAACQCKSTERCCGASSGAKQDKCCADCQAADQTSNAKIEASREDFYPSGFLVDNPCRSLIEVLPCLGGRGTKPRQFNEPRGLAISANGDLFVADSKNHRIQVFGLRGLVLKSIRGRHGNQIGEFDLPWDVAVDGHGNFFVADKGNHRVQKFDCRTRTFRSIDGTVLAAHFFQVLYGPDLGARFVFVPARKRVERWPRFDPVNAADVTIVAAGIATVGAARQLVLKTIKANGAEDILSEWDGEYSTGLAASDPEPAFDSPTHLAVDHMGRLYVVDENKDYVKVLDQAGRVLGQVSFATDVTGAFEPAAVSITPDGKLLVAGSTGLHRFEIQDQGCDYFDYYSAWSGSCTGVTTASGAILITGSGVEGIALAQEPDQFETKGTLFAGPLDSQIEKCQWHRFEMEFQNGIPLGTSVEVSTYSSAKELTADEVIHLAAEEWKSTGANAEDSLIFSEPGQYLWLKIAFRGNGTDTPRLQRLKVHFPRSTYLEYLPAVYQADPVSKDFLGRFLSIFERTFSGVEDEIDGIARLFDPDGTPAAPRDFLTWLAGWLDMIFLPDWSEETRRRLLRNAPELYRKRGTPEGLQLLIKLALDIDIRILEHFKLRSWLFLAGQTGGTQLWGNCIVNRLQLDEYAQIGDFALGAPGDPERDPFFFYAHKFSVFVPAAQLQSETTQRTLRYLIDAEKPAHSQYTLEKVEPRFRLGMQSTLGLDTQIGIYPRLVLSQCSTLGYDTLLGCDPQQQGPPIMQLGEQARVGVSAVVG